MGKRNYSQNLHESAGRIITKTTKASQGRRSVGRPRRRWSELEGWCINSEQALMPNPWSEEEEDKVYGLLGNYTASCGNYLPTFPTWNLDPWRWDRYFVPKRRQIVTTRRRVITQKTTDYINIAAEPEIKKIKDWRWPSRDANQARPAYKLQVWRLGPS
jgi:hypothetical protein